MFSTTRSAEILSNTGIRAMLLENCLRTTSKYCDGSEKSIEARAEAVMSCVKIYEEKYSTLRTKFD